MINEALYNKTSDILYAAYFDGTLVHCSCAACAVGNIIAANMGYEIGPETSFGTYEWRCNGEYIYRYWGYVFSTIRLSDNKGDQIVRPLLYTSEAKEQIDSTGYTWQELAQIEYAFEAAKYGNSEEDYMFNGLVAVLEVLKQIHKVEDDSENVTRFKKHHELLTNQF